MMGPQIELRPEPLSQVNTLLCWSLLPHVLHLNLAVTSVANMDLLHSLWWRPQSLKSRTGEMSPHCQKDSSRSQDSGSSPNVIYCLTCIRCPPKLA